MRPYVEHKPRSARVVLHTLDPQGPASMCATLVSVGRLYHQYPRCPWPHDPQLIITHLEHPELEPIRAVVQARHDNWVWATNLGLLRSRSPNSSPSCREKARYIWRAQVQTAGQQHGQKKIPEDVRVRPGRVHPSRSVNVNAALAHDKALDQALRSAGRAHGMVQGSNGLSSLLRKTRGSTANSAQVTEKNGG